MPLRKSTALLVDLCSGWPQTCGAGSGADGHRSARLLALWPARCRSLASGNFAAVHQLAGWPRVLLLRALRIALSLRSLTNTARRIRTASGLEWLHRLSSLVIGRVSFSGCVVGSVPG